MPLFTVWLQPEKQSYGYATFIQVSTMINQIVQNINHQRFLQAGDFLSVAEPTMSKQMMNNDKNM